MKKSNSLDADVIEATEVTTAKDKVAKNALAEYEQSANGLNLYN